MKVKAKFKQIMRETEKAYFILFIDEVMAWLPKVAIRFGKGNFIIIDIKLAQSKEIKYENYIHIPKTIEPVFNQTTINDLIYEKLS